MLLVAALLAAAPPANAQEAGESRELIGRIGGRTAVINLAPVLVERGEACQLLRPHPR